MAGINNVIFFKRLIVLFIQFNYIFEENRNLFGQMKSVVIALTPILLTDNNISIKMVTSIYFLDVQGLAFNKSCAIQGFNKTNLAQFRDAIEQSYQNISVKGF